MRVDVKIVWNEIYMSMEFRCVKNILLGVYKMIKGERYLYNYFESGLFLWEVGYIEYNDGKKILFEKKKIFFECWFVFYDNKMKFLV